MINNFLIILVSTLTFALLFSSCTKESEHKTQQHEMKMDTATEVTNEICPIMGGKVNPQISTEYKGKKVYFCCSGCIEQFKANPKKYVDKLPQFSNQ